MNGDKSMQEAKRTTIWLSYTPHNLRHYAAAQFYLQHGPTATVSPVGPTTQLEVMQGKIFHALGDYMSMTTDIGKQLAAIIDVVTTTAIDEGTLKLTEQTVHQQLIRWASTATIPPMSHQEMLAKIHPDRIDPATLTTVIESDLAHRTLNGALSCLVKVTGSADSTSVVQIMYATMMAIMEMQGVSRGTQYVAAAVMRLLVEENPSTEKGLLDQLTYICVDLQTPPTCGKYGHFHDGSTCNYCSTTKPCFRAGMLIPTANRQVQSIEDLRQGDTVFSDINNRKREEVLCIFQVECQEQVADLVEVAGHWVTAHHTIHIQGKWVQARLAPGATLHRDHPCKDFTMLSSREEPTWP